MTFVGQLEILPMNTENHNSHLTLIQGPLPPPDILAKYEHIQKGLVDRIVSMAEKESAHRHEVDKLCLNKAFSQQSRGQIFGFLIGIVAIIAGTCAAILGNTLAGSIIGGSGVISLVSVFVIGRRLHE